MSGLLWELVGLACTLRDGASELGAVFLAWMSAVDTSLPAAINDRLVLHEEVSLCAPMARAAFRCDPVTVVASDTPCLTTGIWIGASGPARPVAKFLSPHGTR